MRSLINQFLSGDDLILAHKKHSGYDEEVDEIENYFCFPLVVGKQNIIICATKFIKTVQKQIKLSSYTGSFRFH